MTIGADSNEVAGLEHDRSSLRCGAYILPYRMHLQNHSMPPRDTGPVYDPLYICIDAFTLVWCAQLVCAYRSRGRFDIRGFCGPPMRTDEVSNVMWPERCCFDVILLLVVPVSILSGTS